jgi:hypothetical protein
MESIPARNKLGEKNGMTFGESVLLDCRHKIERAKEHDRALYKEIRGFLDTHPYSLVETYDREHFKYLCKLKIVKPIPQVELALIIGDCVHNARTALDYIAWRLAGSHFLDRNTLFPIYETQSEFEEMASRRKLDLRIHPDALTAIRAVQPYKRAEPKNDHLWFLQELDARDKHKLLTMTQTHCRGARFGSRGDRTEVRVSYGTLDDGAVVAEIQFPIGTPESKVKVDAEPLFDIAFERGILGEDRDFPVSNYIHQIIYRVINVVSQFEELITANPRWIR